MERRPVAPAPGWPFPVLAVATFILATAAFAGLDIPLSAPLLVALGLATAIGVRLGHALSRGDTPARLLILTMTFVFFGVAPLAQIVQQQFPWPGMYDDQRQILALAIVAVGFALFELTYSLAPRRPPLGGPAQVREIRPLGPSLLVAVAIGAVIVTGSAAAFLESREAVAAALGGFTGSYDAHQAAGGGHALPGLLLALITVPLACAAVWLLGTWTTIPRWAWIAVAALVALNLVFNGPIASSRHWAATVAIGMIGARVATPRATVLIAGALLVGFLFVYPVADYFRLNQRTEPIQLVTTPVFTSGDFDAYQQIINGTLTAEARGPDVGRVPLTIVGFAVPRELWDAKPENTGVMIASTAGYSYLNLSAPLWIEGFLDSGWIGLILVSIAFGWLCRLLDSRWRQPGSALRPFVFLIGAYLTLVLRGPLLPAIGVLAVMAGCIAVLVYLAPAPDRRTAPGSPSGRLATAGGIR